MASNTPMAADLRIWCTDFRLPIWLLTSSFQDMLCIVILPRAHPVSVPETSESFSHIRSRPRSGRVRARGVGRIRPVPEERPQTQRSTGVSPSSDRTVHSVMQFVSVCSVVSSRKNINSMTYQNKFHSPLVPPPKVIASVYWFVYALAIAPAVPPPAGPGPSGPLSGGCPPHRRMSLGDEIFSRGRNFGVPQRFWLRIFTFHAHACVDEWSLFASVTRLHSNVSRMKNIPCIQ